MDGVTGETLFTIELRHAIGQGGAQRTIGVHHVTFDVDGKTLGECGLRLVDELVVETNVELVVLLTDVVCRCTGRICHAGLRIADRSR